MRFSRASGLRARPETTARILPTAERTAEGELGGGNFDKVRREGLPPSSRRRLSTETKAINEEALRPRARVRAFCNERASEQLHNSACPRAEQQETAFRANCVIWSWPRAPKSQIACMTPGRANRRRWNKLHQSESGCCWFRIWSCESAGLARIRGAVAVYRINSRVGGDRVNVESRRSSDRSTERPVRLHNSCVISLITVELASKHPRIPRANPPFDSDEDAKRH